MRRKLAWTPAVLMGFGALFTVGIDTQRSLQLEQPLDSAILGEVSGYSARDVELSNAELSIAAPTHYLMRTYQKTDSSMAGPEWFSLYIGYYERQMRGVTIHSPKNCLPGAGWEALESHPVAISTNGETAAVNQYLLQRDNERALVLYWYQGRGRLQANEYLVKWNLLRDAMLRQRSDEALVRLVFPVRDSTNAAIGFARQAAAAIKESLEDALP